jgi:WXG100 family type VII secretion target
MTIEVIHHAFAKATSDVDHAGHRLRTERDRVDRRVIDFLDSGWSGVAAKSFASAWTDWRYAARDVLDGLTAMGELLDVAHADFVESDLDSQARLDALAARLVERLG